MVHFYCIVMIFLIKITKTNKSLFYYNLYLYCILIQKQQKIKKIKLIFKDPRMNENLRILAEIKRISFDQPKNELLLKEYHD